MSLYHSQPPPDYGGFGEFNGFSFRHYLSLLEAANEDASHWLEWQGPLPLYGQTWRAAA